MKIKTIAVQFAGALVAASLLLASVSPVFAAAWTEETQPPASGAATPETLEGQLERERRNLDRLGKALERLDERMIGWRERVAGLKEKGKDTTPLENALDRLAENSAKARELHTQAAALLAEPAGFDAEGKVVDVELAGETLKKGHDLLLAARKTLVPAEGKARQVFRDYWKANH